MPVAGGVILGDTERMTLFFTDMSAVHAYIAIQMTAPLFKLVEIILCFDVVECPVCGALDWQRIG